MPAAQSPDNQPPKAKMRAVIFDLDGVLIDSLPAHLRFAERMAKKARQPQPAINVPKSPKEFKERVAAAWTTDRSTKISPMLQFFRFLDFTPKNAERADRDYRANFKREPIPLFTGVADMLLRLQRHGLKLGIVTSNTRANLRSAFGKWLFLFEPECIFTDDDRPKREKHEAISAAVAALNIDPSEAVFVGDQHSDWMAAQAAGVGFLAVTYGWVIAQAGPEEKRAFESVDTPKSVADHFIGESAVPDCAATKACEDAWSTALDHAREMFTYHAGQRHNSINFYFVALTIVMAGYGGLLAVDSAEFAPLVSRIGIVLGITGVVVTSCFWALDKRNLSLVSCDESLLRVAERNYARALALTEFETVKASDDKNWFTYGNVMPFLFLFLLSINAVAAITFAWWAWPR